MYQTAWRNPVVVRLAGGTQVIRNAAEATDCLSQDWPGSRGRAYERALQVCFRCFEGHVTAEQVRGMFIAACDEADVLISQ
ncbi:DUF982 domain-containing protein [Rhizobium sp. RCC_161_2]|uniref:DUF982 domain-containing protein n=1 Tax=Rhizobium sp. RCC_161_2 TaxID=3239219 RepID=UPI003524EA76